MGVFGRFMVGVTKCMPRFLIASVARRYVAGKDIEGAVAVMRKLICEIEDQRRHAQEGAERLLAQARAEMRQMAKGRRAHRGYQVEIPGQSRLFDGMR